MRALNFVLDPIKSIVSAPCTCSGSSEVLLLRFGEVRLNDSEQLACVERFVEELARALTQRGATNLSVDMCRDEDDRHSRPLRPDPPLKLDAVDARHANVS